jgi:hypothetical protein
MQVALAGLGTSIGERAESPVHNCSCLFHTNTFRRNIAFAALKVTWTAIPRGSFLVTGHAHSKRYSRFLYRHFLEGAASCFSHPGNLLFFSRRTLRETNNGVDRGVTAWSNVMLDFLTSRRAAILCSVLRVCVCSVPSSAMSCASAMSGASAPESRIPNVQNTPLSPYQGVKKNVINYVPARLLRTDRCATFVIVPPMGHARLMVPRPPDASKIPSHAFPQSSHLCLSSCVCLFVCID